MAPKVQLRRSWVLVLQKVLPANWENEAIPSCAHPSRDEAAENWLWMLKMERRRLVRVMWNRTSSWTYWLKLRRVRFVKAEVCNQYCYNRKKKLSKYYPLQFHQFHSSFRGCHQRAPIQTIPEKRSSSRRLQLMGKSWTFLWERPWQTRKERRLQKRCIRILQTRMWQLHLNHRWTGHYAQDCGSLRTKRSTGVLPCHLQRNPLVWLSSPGVKSLTFLPKKRWDIYQPR